MKLVRLADGPVLETFYRDVMLSAFPPDELVTLESLREQVDIGLSEVWGAVGDDGRLLGGMVGEWSPGCRVLLLSYLAVAREGRGRGIGTFLYSTVLDDWRSRYRPCLILAEVENPLRHTGSQAHGDPAARLRFYGRHGARLLDLPYFQPALGPGRRRVPGMLMLALHVDPEMAGAAGPGTVDGGPLGQFMTDYFEGTEGASPQDEAGRALLAAMAAPGGVPLCSVERYRELTTAALG